MVRKGSSVRVRLRAFLRVLLRTSMLLAALVALGCAASAAQGASYFQKQNKRTSIEVHLNSGRIFYLHLEAPIHCTGGGGFVEEIADTRKPIRVDRSGAFAFVDIFRKGSEYGKAVVKGVIHRGHLVGEYRYVHVLG